MGIVHVQGGALHPRHQRQLLQRRDVAIHAEHAIGGQQRGTVRPTAQLPQGGLGIGMRVAAQGAAGQLGAVDQAGVVAPVLHADVALAQQRLQHRQIGHVTAAEQQRRGYAEPVGDLALKRVVGGMVAADQMRGHAAGTFARGHVLQRTGHRELLRQAQVVVAAEIQQPARHAIGAHHLAARTVAVQHAAADADALRGNAPLTLRGDAGGQRLARHLRPLR